MKEGKTWKGGVNPSSSERPNVKPSAARPVKDATMRTKETIFYLSDSGLKSLSETIVNNEMQALEFSHVPYACFKHKVSAVIPQEENRAEALWEQIRHGDAAHQEWLANKLEEFFGMKIAR